MSTEARITWVVGRDMLRTGTEHLSGEGNFKVWPSRKQHDGSLLYLRLEDSQGAAHLAADLRTVRTWLEDTYALIPAGSESALPDWFPFAESPPPPV